MKLWNAQESLSRWLVSHRSAMAPERKRRNVKTKEDSNAVELMQARSQGVAWGGKCHPWIRGH